MTDCPTSIDEIVNRVRGILVGEGFAARADVVAERIAIAAVCGCGDEDEPLEHVLGPATAVRWHSGTEDGPSLTVEWREPPLPGEIAFLVEKLVRIGGEVSRG